MTPTPIDDDTVARSARRKVAWRLLPLLLALYFVAYLDRANLSFAKLPMGEALKHNGFDDAVFGRGAGLFFLGYLLLEVPGALLVERWSARKWFARILVSWGVCSMGMALVTTPSQFYAARVLLGLAEAGFFPGVIVYFTHWFPRRERARALAAMLMAVPVSMAAGAGLSAALLGLDGVGGLAGWQWVFVAEGAPAVLLGLVVPFVLPDRPKDARWLTPAERDWLERTLDAERAETAAAAGDVTLGRVLRLPTVWLLAAGIFCTNLGGYAVVFWLPTVVKGLLEGAGRAAGDTAVLLWTLPVFLAGLVAVVVSGWSSDRTGDRKWHCVAGQVTAAVCLAGSALPGQPWPAVVGWLCLAGFGAYFWIAPYWVLPTLALTASAAAVAVGVINMAANLAGYVGNEAFGQLRQEKVLTDAGLLLLLAGCYLLGGVFVGLVRVRRA